MTVREDCGARDRTTKDEIVEAAARLFYEQGYEHTSFADIAEAVHISRGNFYYHFKAKDEILDAVIHARLVATEAMLERWDSASEHPADRIRSFIRILVANQRDIERYGCPVGTLCAELAKLDHRAQAAATGLFTLFRAWLARQFALLGRAADADALAMHLLARSQGVAALASAFREPAFVEREVAAMCDWLGANAQVTPARNIEGSDSDVRRPAQIRRQPGSGRPPHGRP